MFQQRSLFPPETNEEVKSFQSTIQKSELDDRELDMGDMTFKAGQGESIHFAKETGFLCIIFASLLNPVFRPSRVQKKSLKKP